MTRHALATLVVVTIAAPVHAQGFSSGQTLQVQGGSRFQPADIAPDDPESDRDKAIEARDRFAEGRRTFERERSNKQKELDDLNAAADGIEENAAKTQKGAVDALRNLPQRIGQAASGNRKSQDSAVKAGRKDLEKTKQAAEDFGFGGEAMLGPERDRLRARIRELTKVIDSYRRQEAYWQGKASAAQAEIEAQAEFEHGLERSRRQAAWKAWAEDQLAAARARDNAAAAARANAQPHPGDKGPSTAPTRDGDPSRAGGERATEGKDRDRGDIRIDNGRYQGEGRTRDGDQVHTWK
jgi:hypothetical protein